MSHTISLPQPLTTPTFSLYLEGVYLLTDGGYFLSANNGGGDIGDDAIQTQYKYSLGTSSEIDGWKLFNIHKGSNGQYAIQTVNGYFITANGGGGRITNVLHTDALSIAAWEEFRIAKTGSAGAFSVSIQTNSNNFLTAVSLGGQTSNAIHSDAKTASTWEAFSLRQWGYPASGVQYFIVDASTNQALAARGGGGQTQNTIQFYGKSGVSLDWARFTITQQMNASYAIKTIFGRYLTAVGGGGLDTGTASSDNIHTDATVASTWEQFNFVSSNTGNGKAANDGTFLIQTVVSGKYLGKRTVSGSAEGEYSTDIADLGSASKFWLIPAAFF